MDKEIIKKLIDLYAERSILKEREHIEKGDESQDIEENEKEILSILPKIKDLMNESKDFINYVKRLIKEENEKFQIAFAEPYLEDFFNILLFDIKKNKIIDGKTLDRWKKMLSKEDIEINF